MRTLFLLSFLGLTSANARLMETREECLKRYGEPLKSSLESATWLKADIEITARFHEGACDKIIYKKKAGGVFSEEAVETLKAANANGRKWEHGNPDGADLYEYAFYLVTKENWYLSMKAFDGKTITFMTMHRWREEVKIIREMAVKAEVDRVAAEKKNLEGF